MHGGLHDTIIYCDHVVWYYINIQWRYKVLDVVLPFFRNQWFWAPVYLFLAVYMPANYRRQGLIWCAVFILSFVLSDQVSAHLLKPFFHRLRPCNNPALSTIIHNIVPCGSGYSFPSSHAANHFSIGLFTAATLGKKYRWLWPVCIAWAISVCYAQVYVGVHYPLDVAVGGSIGTLTGLAMGWFFNRYLKLERPSPAGRMPVE